MEEIKTHIGEIEMPKQFTDDELREGITRQDNNDGMVAKFDAVVVPNDPKELNRALTESFEKLKAIGERVRQLPKLSEFKQLQKNKPAQDL